MSFVVGVVVGAAGYWAANKYALPWLVSRVK